MPPGTLEDEAAGAVNWLQGQSAYHRTTLYHSRTNFHLFSIARHDRQKIPAQICPEHLLRDHYETQLVVQRPKCPLCDDEPASREAAIILAYFRRQKMLADPSQMLRAPRCPKCPLSNASRRDPDAS
jgi:hypothetical protein